MSGKIIAASVVVSLASILAAGFAITKYIGARSAVSYVRQNLQNANDRIEDLFETLDRSHDYSMVFLHHSVGHGLLYAGGLRDSLLDNGIVVRGATFGNELGQHTDIVDWPEKFADRMDDILRFKSHPNRYFGDGKTNDIVMFKSCFPNSNILADGQSGNTISRYKEIFNGLKSAFSSRPNTLFIYLTSPPLHPDSTNSENAARAREFNRWIKSDFVTEYTAETGLSNLLAFDLHKILADETGVLKPDYRGPISGDSHPNIEGYQAGAVAFMEYFRPAWDSLREGTVQQ